jgi:chromosome segregation ATPase
MDHSIASLLSSGSTRSSSPSSAKRKALADLESNLSALGHVGLLKYSRDELRRQLQQQKAQTEQQSQAAATLRRVALRLTVNGQEKQEKVAELESTVNQYEEQGLKLLDTLAESDTSTIFSTLSRNPFTNYAILDDESQSMHGPSRPLSPPTTPFDRKISFGPVTPTSSSRKIVSKRRDSHQLPTEVLQLCQQRVEALLQQHRSHRQTIEQLRHSEISLHRIIERQAEELQLLDTAKLKSENELRLSQSKLSLAREELVQLRKHIQHLEREKSSAARAIDSHETRIQFLETELGNAVNALDTAQMAEENLQHAYDNALQELKDAKHLRTSLDDAVRRHENEIDKLTQDGRASQHALSASEEKLSVLQQQLQLSENKISDLQHAITSHEQYKKEQNENLESSRRSHAKVVNELDKVKQKFLEAIKIHQQATKELDNERQSTRRLKSSISSLEISLQKAQSHITELESAQQELERELATTQSLKAGFADSSARLQHDLDIEKARSGKVEASLRKELAGSESKIADLQRSTSQLRAELTTTQSTSSKKTEDLQTQIASLEKDLKNERERASALEVSLREELTQSEVKVTDLQASTAQLKDELAETQNASEKKAGVLQTELSDLEEELRSQKQRATAMEVLGHSNLVDSERKIEALQISTAELKTELTNTLSSSTELVSKLQSDILKLEQELETERNHASTLQAVHEDHKLDAQGKVAALERNATKLEEKLMKAKVSSEQQASSLQAQISKLEQELQTEKDQALTLQATYADHKAEAENKISAHEYAAVQLRESLAKANFASSESTIRLQSEISKLEQDLQSERDRTSELETLQKSHLADSESKTVMLEGVAAQLRQTLVATQNNHDEQVASLHADLERMKVCLADAEKDHQEKHAALLEAENKTKQALSESIDSHTATTAALKQERENVASLQGEQISNQHRITMLDRLVSEARDEVKISKASVGKLDEIRQALQGDLEAAYLSNKQLTEKLSEASISHLTLQEQLDTISQHRSILETELNLSRVLRDQLEMDLAAGRGEAELFRISSSTAETKVKHLESQLSALEWQLSEAVRREKEVNERAHTADHHICELKGNLLGAQSKHHELQHALQESTKQINCLEKAKVQLEEDFDAAQIRLVEAREINHTLQSELDAARANIINLESEKAQISEELKETRTRASQFEAETLTNLSRLQVEKNYSVAELKEAHLRMSQLETAKSQLLTDLNTKISDLESDKARVTEELRSAQSDASQIATAKDGLEGQLNSRISGLQEENTRITGELASAQSKASQIEAEMAALASSLNIRVTELEHDKARVVADLEGLHCRASAEQAQVAHALETAIASLENDKARLLEDHKHAEYKASHLAAEKDKLQLELNSARTTTTSLQEQHSIMQQQIEAATHRLQEENRDLSDRLKRSLAIRNSHHTALGAIRVQLGTAKMAKRSIVAKLRTAEKDLAILQRKHRKLEAELACSVFDLSRSEGASQVWESEVGHLRTEHANLTERLLKSEQACTKLRLGITSLENQAISAKDDFGQLQQALTASEAEIVNLKNEIKELHQQHQDDLQAIRQRDTDIASLQQKIHTKDVTLSRNDVLITEQASKIRSLEIRAAAAESRVQSLESELQNRAAQVAQLQKKNDEQVALISPLHNEINELRASKAALEQIVRTVKHVEGHSRLPLEPPARIEEATYIDHADEHSYYGGSDSVGGVRPLSGYTRVGTSHSNRSSKALRTLGIDSLPETPEREPKSRLWELWEDQRVDGNPHQKGGSPQRSLSRRLSRKPTQEQLGKEKKEHGKLYNLAHFGSLDRPQFIKKAEQRSELYRSRH